MAEPARKLQGDDEDKIKFDQAANDNAREIKSGEEVNLEGPKSQTIYTSKKETEVQPEATASGARSTAEAGPAAPAPAQPLKAAQKAQPGQQTAKPTTQPTPGAKAEKEGKPEERKAGKKPEEKEPGKKEKPEEKAKEKEGEKKPGEAKPKEKPTEEVKAEEKLPEKSTKPKTEVPGRREVAPPAGIKPGAPIEVGAAPATGAPTPVTGPRPAGGGAAKIQRAAPGKRPLPPTTGRRRGVAERAVSAAEKAQKIEQRRTGRGEAGGEDITAGPKRRTGKGASQALKKANLEREAAEQVARGVGKVAGKIGVGKKGQEYITITLITLINIVALIIELVLVETVIGGIVFIINLVVFVWWLLSKGRWKKAWPAGCALIGVGPGFYCCGPLLILVVTVVGGAIMLCSVAQNRIPFGIPISWVGRAVGVFSPDVGALAELCTRISLVGTGTGGSGGSRSSSSSGGSTASSRSSSTSGIVLTQEGEEPITPLIPNTQFTRPTPLTGTGATLANQAGYVSPAFCRLGDIPYSDEVTMRRVRLANGEETIASLPIHQTIECIQNDPAQTELHAIQVGKIVRNAMGDPVLGNYLTIEYPNGLRVSYYHLGEIVPTLTLGMQVEAGQKVADFGQSGQNTFKGTKIYFEIKDSAGTWQPYNPVQGDPNLSILTPFPCADDQQKQCLLL